MDFAGVARIAASEDARTREWTDSFPLCECEHAFEEPSMPARQAAFRRSKNASALGLKLGPFVSLHLADMSGDERFGDKTSAAACWQLKAAGLCRALLLDGRAKALEFI